MNPPISPTVKIIILMVLAAAFAATLLALSVQVGPGNLAGARFGNGSKQYSENFNVAPGGTLRLDTDIGDVRITGGDENSVAVTVSVEGDIDDVADFIVKMKETDNGVEVFGRNRNRNGWHFGWGDFDARFVVTVPKNFNLRVETSGGDIEITGVGGTLKGSTSGGDVRITDVAGEANIETSGGDIRGNGILGSLSVETSGGDIDIRQIRAKACASTSGGDVRLELLENLGVDASTSGGNIVLTFPAATGAEIYAETVGGSVRCDFPVRGTMDDGSLRGDINGGGKRVRAETSGGDISIRPPD
ncbi:MAG TPA: DUF4097 family beta strand repeat-containing protein [Bacteroidota bacterium]|nr:DUF4097 family beta strand repeat-containing protein [Bacteroidota bacterium]